MVRPQGRRAAAAGARPTSGGSMRSPLTFAWRNVVFGHDIDDAWALFRVQPESYSGLSASAKRQLLAALASFAYSIEADFQLLRVARAWSPTIYVEAARSRLDRRFGHAAEFDELVASHRIALGDREIARPEIYCGVRLCPSQSWSRQLRRAIGAGAARTISRRRVRELLDLEAKT